MIAVAVVSIASSNRDTRSWRRFTSSSRDVTVPSTTDEVDLGA
jgi:hypothetical protein